MSKKSQPARAPQEVVAALENALAATMAYADVRRSEQLSVNRLAGVAREIRELIKVMSVYTV